MKSKDFNIIFILVLFSFLTFQFYSCGNRSNNVNNNSSYTDSVQDDEIADNSSANEIRLVPVWKTIQKNETNSYKAWQELAGFAFEDAKGNFLMYDNDEDYTSFCDEVYFTWDAVNQLMLSLPALQKWVELSSYAKDENKNTVYNVPAKQVLKIMDYVRAYYNLKINGNLSSSDKSKYRDLEEIYYRYHYSEILGNFQKESFNYNSSLYSFGGGWVSFEAYDPTDEKGKDASYKRFFDGNKIPQGAILASGSGIHGSFNPPHLHFE